MMIDPTTIRLAQVQHQERLAAAAQARERANWTVEPYLARRLWAVIARRANNLVSPRALWRKAARSS